MKKDANVRCRVCNIMQLQENFTKETRNLGYWQSSTIINSGRSSQYLRNDYVDSEFKNGTCKPLR